jgi:hypothetical protein
MGTRIVTYSYSVILYSCQPSFEGKFGVTVTKSNKPGTPAPASGQYKQPGSKTEITSIKGKPLPPTPKPGGSWAIVDKTKHKK